LAAISTGEGRNAREDLMGNTPVFNARFISNSSFDKMYRIYAVSDQLFFIRIGGQGGLQPGLTHQLGILGLLIEPMMKKRAEKREKALIETIDRTDPEQLLASHKDNFRLRTVELQGGTLDPPSFFATHGLHVGRWRLNLRDGKKMDFQFENTEDMRSALDVLPNLFSSSFRVNVRWNENKKRYEKKEDAA